MSTRQKNLLTAIAMLVLLAYALGTREASAAYVTYVTDDSTLVNNPLYSVVADNPWTTPGTPPPITPGTGRLVHCPEELSVSSYGHLFDKAKTSFYIYLPNNFNTNKTCGVVSMLWGSAFNTTSEEWKRTWDARDIIYVCAQGGGNSVFVGYRNSLAQVATEMIKKYYNIDTNRVFVAGHSGGGSCALRSVWDLPNQYRGVIESCGEYFRDGDFPVVRANVRFALVNPLYDGSTTVVMNDYYDNKYIPGGYQAMMMKPAQGHEATKSPELIKGMNFLESYPLDKDWAPVALSQTVNVAANAAKGITLLATDEALQPLSYILVTPPANGNVTVSGAVATYTPNAGYSGPDSFTFKANDGLSDSNIATVTINVRANAAPVASNITTSTPEDTTKPITLTATDANSDPLTYSVVTSPTQGTLTGTAPNISYVPSAGWSGSDSFTYKANDSYQDSTVATVNITVTSINDQPVANNLTALVQQSTPIQLLLTATDSDSTYLTYSVVTSPTSGTLSGFAPNVIYTPNAGYTGGDTFTFRAHDGTAYSGNATVSLTVSATANGTLIDHTFNEGTGTLNGTLVDAGTLKDATPTLAWVTDTGTLITANGIMATGSSNRTAYVQLGSAIVNGAICELTVTLPRPSGTFVTAGFFDGATPNLIQNMESNGGTAWFLRRSTIEVNRGLGYDGAGNGYASPSRINSTVSDATQTFTIKLDLSAANGVNNWGNMTVYAGDSATGTVMGGYSNVPFTSAQHFSSVGFSAREASGSITSLKLTRKVPEYGGTSATVSIAATDPNAAEVGAENGEFTLTRSGYTGGVLNVTLALSGTASDGIDYETLSTTVNFPAGQTAVTVPVVPIPDISPTEGDETVIATITPDSTYSVAASPANAATVTIADDNKRTLTVTSHHGTPFPGGVTTNVYGTIINASVNSPIVDGTSLYVATGWIGNGSVGSGTGTNVSFAIENDTAITWLWQTNLFNTITATAGANGSITPDGTVFVIEGSNQLFTITPAMNFIVSTVTVDSVSIGAVTSYAFTNVTSAHTIDATFAVASRIDATWTNTSSGDWSTDANWNPLAPGSTAVSTNADTAIFGNAITNAATITVDNNRNIAGITFAGNNNAYTLTNGNILLSSGGVIQTLGSGTANTNAIKSAITLQGDATFTADSSTAGRLLSITTNVMGVATAGVTNALTLSGSNTAANVISGVVANGAGGGKLAVVKGGTGSWTLAGRNTFTGDLIINGGTLTAGGSVGANTLGNPNVARNIIINTNATLVETTADQLGGVGSLATVALVINGGTYIGRGNVGTLGNVVLNGGAMQSDGGQANGSLQVNGTLTVTGTAASVISSTATANSQYNLNNQGTRATTFNVGDVTASPAVDLAISSSVKNGFSTAASHLIKSGGGTVLLSNTNRYTGNTTISNGTLVVNGSLSTGGVVSVASAGMLGGTGVVSCVVTSTGAISPGFGGIGTLTTSNVTWNAGAAWPFELGTDSACDRLNINGTFTKGTGTGFVFDLQNTGATGVYTLVTWSGSTTFAVDDFSATNAPAGMMAAFAVNSGTLTLIQTRIVTVAGQLPHAWLAAQNPAWTTNNAAAEVAATNDPDHDGFTTTQEYWTGTDPQDSNSVFRITSTSINGTNVSLTWVNSKVDSGIPPLCVQHRTNLTLGSWQYAGQKAPVNGTNTWTGALFPSVFYRIAATNVP